jgi:GNAT superfamily N-acetyltransferase
MRKGKAMANKAACVERPAGKESSRLTIRPLKPDDLASVVAIDRTVTGRSRRSFYERRLAHYAREPSAFVALAAELDGRFAGFAFARLYEGEFGGVAREAALDAIGVDPELRHHRVGAELVAGLLAAVRTRGARELTTQVDWAEADLLGFFSHTNFTPAPRLVLERAVAEPTIG